MGSLGILKKRMIEALGNDSVMIGFLRAPRNPEGFQFVPGAEISRAFLQNQVVEPGSDSADYSPPGNSRNGNLRTLRIPIGMPKGESQRP